MRTLTASFMSLQNRINKKVAAQQRSLPLDGDDGDFLPKNPPNMAGKDSF